MENVLEYSNLNKLNMAATSKEVVIPLSNHIDNRPP